MEGGELAAESMDTLTELGDELTLGDIDGGRREKERGWGGVEAARVGSSRVAGAALGSPRGCWGGRRGCSLGRAFWSVPGVAARPWARFPRGTGFHASGGKRGSPAPGGFRRGQRPGEGPRVSALPGQRFRATSVGLPHAWSRRKAVGMWGPEPALPWVSGVGRGQGQR